MDPLDPANRGRLLLLRWPALAAACVSNGLRGWCGRKRKCWGGEGRGAQVWSRRSPLAPGQEGCGPLLPCVDEVGKEALGFDRLDGG